MNLRGTKILRNFSLLGIFILTIIFANNVIATSPSKTSLDEINHLGIALDNCALQQKAQREKAEEIDNSGKSTVLQKLNYELVDCYQKIAYQTFDEFYPEKKTEMKKSFDSYVTASYEFNSNIYSYNSICYQSCQKDCINNCGLLAHQMSTQATANEVYNSLLNILIYTENMLKH